MSDVHTISDVLVTGGAGFIGSNLVRALLDRDCRVRVLDDLSLGSMDNLAGLEVEFLKGDVRFADVVLSAVKGVDAVFHLAAIPGVPQSIEDPIGTTGISVMGTLNVLEAARRYDAAVIFASSCSVYGNNQELPLSEDSTVVPLSPYATAKLSCEMFIRNYRDLHGIKGAAMRFFNVYGPRQDPNSYYSAVIPKFIHRCLSGSPPVIYGDGSQTRDFVYVEDLVSALISAATAGELPPVINLGSGSETSVQELAEKVIDLTGFDGSPEYAPPRPGEVMRSRADISLAKDVLGWKPQHSLEDGLKKTIQWLSQSG